jgi:hypothetical protein
MGTIPAPNIAELGGEIAAAPQNALAEYARVAQIKQQTQQAAAMAPLLQQGAQQQIEMQRRQMADQDALTKAITQYDPAKHTLADIPKLVTQNGGSGQAALQAQSGLVTQRQNLSKLSAEQFAQEQKKADLIQGVHDQVSQAAPEEKQQTYQQGLQSLARAGVDVSKEPPQYPGDDVFAQHLPAIRLHSAILAESEKDREQTTKESEAATKAAEAVPTEEREFQPYYKAYLGANNLEPSPANELAARDRFRQQQHPLPVEQTEMRDWIAKHPGKGPAEFMAAKAALAPTINFNLQNKANPDDVETTAQALANGSMKWSDILASRTPLSQKTTILKRVKEINPSYSSGDFGVEQAVRKDFTSGAAAKNITAFNTAIAHANQMQQAADALDNGDLPSLNKIGNALGYQFGSDKMTNFNVIKNALSGEISKVFKGGEATDAEIKAVQEPFSSANSSAQLKGAIQNAIHLMNSKRDFLKQQYDQGIQGKPNFGGGGSGTPKFNVGDSVMYQGKPHKVTAVDPQTGKLSLAP